jgi:putative Mg2+ transporter-C (MgtC) family protein
MPIHLEWSEIALRLACTIVAGFIIGFDRGEHGRPAGLRTTMLVSLAACVAMLQANILLPIAGKAPNSFVSLDLMRLPLGILSGMGFIGAGAIVRRENLVLGVTTAATLWFVTVLGLCFGGGQIALGLIGLFLGTVVLAGLRRFERGMKQDRQGTFTVLANIGGLVEEEVRTDLLKHGYRVISCTLISSAATGSDELTYQIGWHAPSSNVAVPDFVRALSTRPGVIKVAWVPQTN